MRPLGHGEFTESILSGLHEIARDYDALVCDVWGVLHNGSQAHAPAVDALKRFRGEFGPVVLLSNAPRPVDALEEQFKTRRAEGLLRRDRDVRRCRARRSRQARREGGRLAIYHLGPERDRGVFEGLPIDCVEPDKARVVLCTGLFDDDHETPDDYRELLEVCAAAG